MGKSRASVSNLLRLNGLNEPVKRLLEHMATSIYGHARALLTIEGEEQTNLARLVAAKELTVRETERLINQTLNPLNKPKLRLKIKMFVV